MSCRNQDYENFVAKQDFSSAILLALSLDQPRRLLNLFTAIINKRVDADSVTGSKAVDHALRVLSPQAILQLLGFVRGWNTSIRTSDVAQTVLNAILRFYPAHKLLELDETSRALDTNPSIFDQSGSKRHQSKPNLGDLLEGLVPYTQRHFSRSDRAYSQESFVLDYTLR